MKRTLALIFLLLLDPICLLAQNANETTLNSSTTVFTLPLLSTATVNSFSGSSGSQVTANCSVAGCGFTAANVGQTVNMGQGISNPPNPLGCQGAATINSVSGNSVTITFTTSGKTCPNGSGPFQNVFGTYGNVIDLVPAQGNNPSGGNPAQYTAFNLDYDGHINIVSVYSAAIPPTPTVEAGLDVDTTGQAWLYDSKNPIAFGTEMTSQARATAGAGGICFGGSVVANGSACPGMELLYDSANGVFDQVVKYGGISSVAQANFTPSNIVGSQGPANSLAQSNGMVWIPVQFSPSATITPSAGATNTSSSGTIFTAPNTNYGAGTFYELFGVLVCSSNCANGQSAYVSVTYNDGVASRTLSTCGTPGGAGSVYAVCTTPPTTPWNFTTNPSMPMDFHKLFLGGGKTISFTVTTTNGGVAQPVYYIAWGVEAH